MRVTGPVGFVCSALPIWPFAPRRHSDDDDMAGLTTASLVGLYQPESEPEPEPDTELDHGVFFDQRASSTAPRSSRLTAYLGLDHSVLPLNAIALASSALLSITLLVFL